MDYLTFYFKDGPENAGEFFSIAEGVETEHRGIEQGSEQAHSDLEDETVQPKELAETLAQNVERMDLFNTDVFHTFEHTRAQINELFDIDSATPDSSEEDFGHVIKAIQKYANALAGQQVTISPDSTDINKYIVPELQFESGIFVRDPEYFDTDYSKRYKTMGSAMAAMDGATKSLIATSERNLASNSNISTQEQEVIMQDILRNTAKLQRASKVYNALGELQSEVAQTRKNELIERLKPKEQGRPLSKEQAADLWNNSRNLPHGM